jgi:FkbM family methyltransferase
MYFALRTARDGTAIVIEPDQVSTAAFQAVATQHGLNHVRIAPLGAWSHRSTLKLRIRKGHEAANFTEGCAEYDEKEAANFEVLEIEADSVDNILRSYGISHVDLVSITTNGAEDEILAGMHETMARGLRYVCLAVTRQGLIEHMDTLGYDFVAHDDRGHTFRQRSSSPSRTGEDL